MKNVIVSVIFCLCFSAFSGETLIAEWDFSKVDSVKGAFQARVRGKTSICKDATGNFLRIAQSDGRKAEGLTAVKIYPQLSPATGFRVIVRLRPGSQQPPSPYQMLVDSKYICYPHKNPAFNKGFAFYLLKQNKHSSGYLMLASVGFGKRSVIFEGPGIHLEKGKISELSFSWDSFRTATFGLNGKILKTITVKNGGVMAPAVYSFTIGDRSSGSFQPFCGDLYNVKLYSFPIPDISADLKITGRLAFLRNEKNAHIKLDLNNRSKDKITGISITGSVNGKKIAPITSAALAAGGKTRFLLPVDTCLTPGRRACKLFLEYTKNGRKNNRELKFQCITAPLTGDRMPVVMWGAVTNPYKKFLEYGFTHNLRYMFSGVFVRRLEDRFELAERLNRQFDNMLADGFRAVDSIETDMFKKKYPRIDRQGKPYPRRNLDATDPRVIELIKTVAEEASSSFADHPAVEGLLINSEVRDNSQPSFTKTNFSRWEKLFGKEFLRKINGRAGPHWRNVPAFPLSRVIPDNDPIYKFYQWWWREGDGWNPAHTLIHKIYKKNMKHPQWTFYDPAVRVPPIWGNGGETDFLNHWTYATPDPLNIGTSTSETFAMAKGRPGQGVMNMTQLISYRSLTAPIGKKVRNPPAWVKRFPKSNYISLAPDLLQEAFWIQISRKVAAVMFHGDEAIIPDPALGNKAYYACTNERSRDVLKNLLNTVVHPLGPVLKRVPERPLKVAVLESFASYVYAERGTFGWYGWPFELNNALQWANLQPGVIYEDEILRDGFGNIQVLVMPHCDVLPESVYRKIKKFQQQGGIIAADSSVAPGIIPDIIIEEVRSRSGAPLENKKKLQTLGLKLRKELEPFFRPYVCTSNPDIVTWVRSSGNADYLFAVNDKRTFGTYYGQYGLVAEKGVPNSGKITIARSAGAVYDLVKHKAVPFTVKDGKTILAADYRTNDGRLYLLLPAPVKNMVLNVPSLVDRGKPFHIGASIFDVSGKLISSVHPLQITFLKNNREKTDDSGFGAFLNGHYKQEITLPMDMKPGRISVCIRDLASGISLSKTIMVR